MIHVYLNVYDVTNTQSDGTNDTIVKINNVTRQLGIGGVFHGGIEVDGYEWSFGYCERGTGVYSCTPKQNPMYCYRETIDLGRSDRTRHEVKDIIRSLREAWQGSQYDLLARNCCHFCEALAKDLGVKQVPGWVNRFAQGADATVTFTTDAVAAMRTAGQELSRTCQASASWIRDSWHRTFHTPETTLAQQLSNRSFLWWRETPSRSASHSPARSDASSNPESSAPSQTGSDTPMRRNGSNRSLAMRLIPNQHSLASSLQRKATEDSAATTSTACLLPPTIVTADSSSRASPRQGAAPASMASAATASAEAEDISITFADLSRRAYEAASDPAASSCSLPDIHSPPPSTMAGSSLMDIHSPPLALAASRLSARTVADPSHDTLAADDSDEYGDAAILWPAASSVTPTASCVAKAQAQETIRCDVIRI